MYEFLKISLLVYHLKDINLSPKFRKDTNLTGRNEFQFQTNSTITSNNADTQRYENGKNVSIGRTKSKLNNLPPIVIESDKNIKDFILNKNDDSRSILPEFRSPISVYKQLNSFNSKSKIKKTQHLKSHSPTEEQIHQNSFLSSNYNYNVIMQGINFNQRPTS